MIPKIIHYCWLSDDPFPDDIKACIYSWKKHLPCYEFKLWNFSCFDIESSKWVKEAFLSRKYAFASDYIRLYALYNYGGIYLDCDVEVLKSFDNLLNLPYFIGKEKSDNVIEAATMGFEKGHPLLKELLGYYKDRKFRIKGDEFDIRPLPSIVLEHINKRFVMKELGHIRDFEYDAKVISIFPVDYFSPKTWDTKELTLTSNTYSIHHFSGSWIKNSFANKISFWRYRFLGLFMQKYKI